MCPENPIAYVFMANVYMMHNYTIQASGMPPKESIEKGIEMAQKALAMDDTIGQAHGFLGELYLQKKEFDKAIAESERAVALDPGGTDVYLRYVKCLGYAGRFEEAISASQKAIRLNPFAGPATFLHLGHALWGAGRFEEAVSAYKKVLQLSPNDIWAHLRLAGTYMMMGREKEARAEAAEVLRINPKFSLDSFAKAVPYKDQSVIDKLYNACRKAGL
jgi:adenylate cyclase